MRVDLIPNDFNGSLVRLSEECSEVIKAVCKIQRFGVNHTDQKTGIVYNNIKDLKSEISDVYNALSEVEKFL